MKKVMVVDDEPDILKVISFRLQKAGYEVLTAINGKIALDLVYSNRPDLILLDLRMPVMTGDEVCTKIKNDPALCSIPIIILTASTGSKLPAKAKELKADDYLLKPFDSEVMFQKVQKIIG